MTTTENPDSRVQRNVWFMINQQPGIITHDFRYYGGSRNLTTTEDADSRMRRNIWFMINHQNKGKTV